MFVPSPPRGRLGGGEGNGAYVIQYVRGKNYVTFYVGCSYVMLLTTVEEAGKERIMHNSDRQTITRK